MKCFYHNDLDGKASAFCVYAWAKDLDTSSKYISINYGTVFPIDSITSNERIWILDYSIDPDEMLKLLEITSDIVWIDHHKTAIEKYKNFSKLIKGIRIVEEAACVLTWKYINCWTDKGYDKKNFDDDSSIQYCKNIPRCILLTGDRDNWTWKYGEETKNFYAGSQIYNTDPDSRFWWQCIEHEIDSTNIRYLSRRLEGEKFWNELLKAGQIIEKFKLQFYNELAEDIGYETQFSNIKCFAINAAHVSSDVFGDLVNHYDVLLPYYHDGKQWTVSLYTIQDIDVSMIAKQFGGGGHKKAAGFQCKNLPFNRL